MITSLSGLPCVLLILEMLLRKNKMSLKFKPSDYDQQNVSRSRAVGISAVNIGICVTHFWVLPGHAKKNDELQRCLHGRSSYGVR